LACLCLFICVCVSVNKYFVVGYIEIYDLNVRICFIHLYFFFWILTYGCIKKIFIIIINNKVIHPNYYICIIFIREF
jgi:hypothetical protein